MTFKYIPIKTFFDRSKVHLDIFIIVKAKSTNNQLVKFKYFIKCLYNKRSMVIIQLDNHCLKYSIFL